MEEEEVVGGRRWRMILVVMMILGGVGLGRQMILSGRSPTAQQQPFGLPCRPVQGHGGIRLLLIVHGDIDVETID